MAGADRAAADRLMHDLSERPYEFDFYQAVRRLECARSDLPRVGWSQRLADDAVRFSQEPSLAFAPSTVWDLKFSGERGPAAPRMFVNFIGLFGPNGPLPLHLTEYARDRERNHGDPTLARFLDIFHHRIVSLFYRAWASNQKTVSMDRGIGAADDRFAAFIASLFGAGMDTLQARSRVEDHAARFYSGRLVSQARNAEGLRAIISDYFGVPTELHEFSGQWMPLPTDCRCRLGASRATGLLGSTALVGSSMWECQQKFRLRLGPLSIADYVRMLPTGESLGRLKDWVRLYAGDELTWDLQLVLLSRHVPPVRLGHAGESRGEGRLGWTTWLASGPPGHDPDDLVLRPQNTDEPIVITLATSPTAAPGESGAPVQI